MRFLAALILSALVLAGCDRPASVPPAPADSASIARQAEAFVEAMKPRRPGKPVVAVLARNEATETTDFLLTHAVLQRSGVAEVHAVAPRRGRVHLYPTLEIEVAQDFAGFDQAHPRGADYVIVPALDDADDPAINAWLQAQAKRGARIVGVCLGALVVGRAGLLDGRRFVTHWFGVKKARERHPGATYVPNQRYVVDRDVATTTGITASIPTTLALVEAIGGKAKAREVAAELGVEAWTPAHDSSAFGLGVRRAAGYLLAKAAFWRRETWRAEAKDGMDDVALALAADAWSRTGYVRVEASAPGPVKLRSGLVLLPEPVPADAPPLPLAQGVQPAQQLKRTLCEIEKRYGEGRREWVAMELEYPGSAAACRDPA